MQDELERRFVNGFWFEETGKNGPLYNNPITINETSSN
jgi:hypothetical protein